MFTVPWTGRPAMWGLSGGRYHLRGYGGAAPVRQYPLRCGGDGLNMFMDDPLKTDEGMLDYQVLLTYITEELGGSIDSIYGSPQGRIKIE